MSDNRFRLITLGGAALLRPDGRAETSLGTRRRKLAVLAYLAAARRPAQRAVLLDMFWGGQEEERARHSLSDALSHIRRVLGPTAVSARRTEIALSPEAPLVVDAVELVRSAAHGDYAGVLSLYQGPYLAGVEVEGPAFEAWLLRERERLRCLVVEAAERHSRAQAERGEWDAAAEASRRWLEAEPLSAEAAVTLLTALSAPGTREGRRRALSEYRQLAALLAREYDWEPDDRVSALAARIEREEDSRSGPAAGRSEVDGLASPADPPAGGGVISSAGAVGAAGDGLATGGEPVGGGARKVGAAPVAGGRSRRRLWVSAAAAAGLCLVATAVLARRGRAPTTAATPAVAILDVRNLTGEPADTWLEQGLPQMIGAALFRAGDVGVVPPEQVRDVRRRSDGAFEWNSLTLAQALDLARRIGATTMVRGGVSHGGGGFTLDLTVYDVAAARPLDMVTVRDTSVLRLADAAAARLEGVLGGRGRGPGVAEAETPSLEAYRHYLAALQAEDEGRTADAGAELNAALAADSQFVAALRLKADLAGAAGDAVGEKQALAAAARAGARASPFDRLELAVRQALLNGERGRPIQLARELVGEYPRDPRAYGTLAGALFAHGRFAEEEQVLQRALALDSLGMEAGRGPCVPCVGYGGLASVRLLRGDMAGGVAAARRWVQLEPDVPAAWASLGSALSMAGDFAGAEQAQQRAAALEPNLWLQNVLVRTWIMAGRYAAADSALGAWERAGSAEAKAAAVDLRSTLQREQGQFRAAARTLAAGGDEGIALVLANTASRIGDPGAARRIYEQAGHPTHGTSAERARAFCWAHALEAEDLASAGDTSRLRALADSIDAVARLSYYARDWRLADHVRGLLDLSAGRDAEAVRELQRARFGVAGWTATNMALARAQLALRRPDEAITTLRQALMGPLDGMGRYIPRTEIDYALARAYRAAGQDDSARAYAATVRRAWAQADPEVRARLAGLP